MSEWISVKDCIPTDEYEVYLWLWEQGSLVTLNVLWSVKGFIGNGISHWMPLPEPPVKGE